MRERRNPGLSVAASGATVIPFPGTEKLKNNYNGATMCPETAPAARSTGSFRLGEWEVRPLHNELVSGQETRHLEPKMMDLLVFMASVAPDVASKNSIIDSVWEGRIISEGTLTNSIAELRRILGDDARRPRYIETIPKRGYCLIESVDPLPLPEADAGQSASQLPKTRLAICIAILAIAVIAVTLYVLRSGNKPLDPNLVLVAPFVNRTGDASLDTTGLLARDRLLAAFSESGLVRAIPAPVEGGAEGIEALCAAARTAGAGLSVAGNLYLHEGQVEIQAKLVDVQEAALLYAVPASIADRDAMSEALDTVVRRAVGAIATHRSAHGHFQLMSHTPAVEAYREFITASELFAVDVLASIHHLERALELDPNFTSASLRLSAAYRKVGRKVDAAALLARVEDRRSALTQFERLWLDYFKTSQDHRLADALVLIRRIEEAVPDDPVVQHIICGNTAGLNRPRETIAAASFVIEKKGLAGFLYNPIVIKDFLRCASSHHRLGDHEAEFRAVRLGLERFPTNDSLLVAEARALTALGDDAGLEETISKALSTPTKLGPASLLIEAAATARAHDRPNVARDLARRGLLVLEERAATEESAFEGLVHAQALVYVGELDRAQEVLVHVLSMDHRDSTYEKLAAQGWLGVVAARIGDLETAQAIDNALRAYEGPYRRGWPAHYRAAIAAWLGHRDQAMNLLSKSLSEGWGSFQYFHDSHRVFFEPLEGMEPYEAILHPDG